MKAQVIEQRLIDYTLEVCKFESSRKYISMSHIADEPDQLVHNYLHGFQADIKSKLKCYKGYCMEADIALRLKAAMPEVNIHTEVGYSTTDGLFQCHPDFTINSVPADCKSVLRDDWIPQNYNAISRRIKYQMNGQMLLGEAEQSFLIFESRESGLIIVYDIYPDKKIVDDILKKMDQVRLLIKNLNS